MAAAACTGHGSPASTAGQAGPEKPDLVVAVVPAEANAGLYIAQAEGLFTKAGLHVTIKPVVSAAAVIPAMLHGSVDVDGGGYVSYILPTRRGREDAHPGRRVRARPARERDHRLSRANIQSPTDLRGKTIAVNQLGSVGQRLEYTALAPYGNTPEQVHLVAMPFPAMPGALAAGKIDAAYETEPFVTQAVKKYGVQAVTDLDGGATQDFPLTGYAVLDSWAAEVPAHGGSFKAIEQGNAIAATNLAILQQVLSDSLRLSPNITGVMATGTFPTSANPVQIQRAADLMLHYGQLKEPFNVKSLIGG